MTVSEFERNSEMECYLDNAATTRVLPETVHLINKIFLEDYANPASLHKKGFEAERYIDEALSIFSAQLGCKKGEITFTSGGTESDNAAIIGCALKKFHRQKRMITTAIEHPAVSSTMKFLESRGWQIDYIRVDSEGIIDLSHLEELLSSEAALVSIMHVNNEIGAIQPIAEAGEIIRRKAPDCLFHVDDVQGYGKIALIPKKFGIDLLSVSSHKIHGPKGVGLLYASKRSNLSPIIFGGGHQGGRRSGTENVPAVAGFALAAKAMYESNKEDIECLKALRSRFIEGISKIDAAVVNGPKELAAPYIVSVSIEGVRAEVLLHALEERGIYISAGSACSSSRTEKSPTLSAIGVPDWALESTVRFSFSRFTTVDEIDFTLDALAETVPLLRKFTRK